uniref:HBS1 like translational GTPase n=1 Tax=Varanus komodoensis TaxID=61221 RepID=A0A8D2L0Z9_VARKO
MARHRNVRGYNYDEDFEEDDLYGQSVEDDYCISPSTAAQFIYSRRDNPSAFAERLEEYGYEDKGNCVSRHQLTEVEKVKIDSCLDHMREVLGDSVPEQVMVEAILSSKFDVQEALDYILAQDNKQNVKTKNEDTVIAGKATKGLFCSETFSNDNSLLNLVENPSDSTSLCPIDNFESPSFSTPSDKISFRPKYIRTSSIKKKTSGSFCKSMGEFPVPFSGNNISLYEPFSKQVTLSLADSTGAAGWQSCKECNVRISSDAELSKENPSENVSWNQSNCKGVQDLRVLFRLNETGDSSDAQDHTLIVLPKNSDCDRTSCLDSPPALMSALGNLVLDSKINNKINKKTEHFENIPPLLQNKAYLPGQNSSCSETESLIFSMSESPSLADLLQEHQENNSNKTCSLSHLQNPLSSGFTEVELRHSSLSQLANQPQISSGMTELSGSLSSLTVSKSSPVKELETLSLSDLIAKSIEVDKPETSNCSGFHVAKAVQPAVVNSDIDLSVLIKKSALSPEPVEVQSGKLVPEPEAVFAKKGRQIFIAERGKKNKKRMRSCALEGSVPWIKALSARPSAFAITLCLRYPPKRCKRKTVNLHKAFLYSSQMQEVKINEVGPFLAITPFDFKSPSPDDIVKSGQKKAFTRQ